jgi:hypothetical protein
MTTHLIDGVWSDQHCIYETDNEWSFCADGYIPNLITVDATDIWQLIYVTEFC